IRTHVGFELFDYVLVNRQPVAEDVQARYARRGSMPVERDRRRTLSASTVIVERDLAWQVTNSKIRHAPDALASAILELTCAGRPRQASTPAMICTPGTTLAAASERRLEG